MTESVETSSPPLRRWLLFIYRVPQDPPGRRTYLWRQLRGLGALYLQQAAAIVPESPETRQVLEALATRVRGYDGEVSLLATTSPDLEWEQDIIARFNAARDEEYAEVIEGVERFEDEIARETRKQKFTFAELEDIEADWEKLARWRQRIEGRDFFGAESRVLVEDAVARGRVALLGFTTAVAAHESTASGEQSD